MRFGLALAVTMISLTGAARLIRKSERSDVHSEVNSTAGGVAFAQEQSTDLTIVQAGNAAITNINKALVSDRAAAMGEALASVLALDFYQPILPQLTDLVVVTALSAVPAIGPILSLAYGFIRPLIFDDEEPDPNAELAKAILTEVQNMIQENNNMVNVQKIKEAVGNVLTHYTTACPYGGCFKDGLRRAGMQGQVTNGFQQTFAPCWNTFDNNTCRDLFSSRFGRLALEYQVQFTELALGTFMSMLEGLRQQYGFKYMNKIADIHVTLEESKLAVKRLQVHFDVFQAYRRTWPGMQYPQNSAYSCYRRDTATGRRRRYRGHVYCNTTTLTDAVSGIVQCPKKTIHCGYSTETLWSSDDANKTNAKNHVNSCISAFREQENTKMAHQLQEIQALSDAADTLGYRIPGVGFDCPTAAAVGGSMGGEPFGWTLKGLTSDAECRRVGKVLLKIKKATYTFEGSRWGDRPAGCSWWPGGKKLLWNFNTSGRKHSAIASICKVF